jgi:hypothetical protein
MVCLVGAQIFPNNFLAAYNILVLLSWLQWNLANSSHIAFTNVANFLANMGSRNL